MASKRWWLVVAAVLALCAANAPLLTESGTDEREGCESDRDEDTTAAVGSTRHGRELLATGQYLTPTAAPGSTLQFLATGLRPDGNGDANGAYTSVLSPDGKTLLVLTNGFNANYFTTAGEPIQFPYLDPLTGMASTMMTTNFQWVFVYDVSSGEAIKTQQITIPSAYAGLAWDPSGNRFFVSGGQEDRIYIYKRNPTGWVPDAPFIVLNH